MAEPPDLLTLPFDQFQRYAAVAEIAGAVRTALGQPRLCVLDVGGFHRTPLGQAMLPLPRFLPSDLTIATDLAIDPLPSLVRASGTALPFGSGAFDLVVSCDTLEHVPAPDRPAFVSELLRVAGHCAVLIAPFDGEPTRRAECIVRGHLATRRCTHRPLEEHFEQGLPAAGDLRSLLVDNGLEAIEFADGYLPHWLAMIVMQLAEGVSPAFLANLNRFYNRHFSPGDRREPAYRRVFVIAKPGREALLDAVARAVEPPPTAGCPDPDFAEDLVHLLKQAHYDGDSRVAFLETENERLRRVIEGYEQGRFIRLMRRLHDWRERPPERSHGR